MFRTLLGKISCDELKQKLMDIEFILNDALNKALITDRIKGVPSSNRIADFVSRYIETEQLILPVVTNCASKKTKTLGLEVFKKIKGFENYEVSNLGNVKNNHGKILKTQEREHKKHAGPVVGLVIEPKKRKFLMVKRLVADAFICDVKGKNVLIKDINKPIHVANLVVLERTRNPY